MSGIRRYNHRRNPFDPSLLISFRNKRRNIDPTRLTAFRNPCELCGCDCKTPQRRNVDPSRLTAFRRHRNVDPSRLTAFRGNPDDRFARKLWGWRGRQEPRPVAKPDDLGERLAKAAIAHKERQEERRREKIARAEELETRIGYVRKQADSYFRRKGMLPRLKGRKMFRSSRMKSKPRRYRRNPCPEGKPWGPQLYNPLTDDNNKFKNERHYKRMISKLRRNPW